MRLRRHALLFGILATTWAAAAAAVASAAPAASAEASEPVTIVGFVSRGSGIPSINRAEILPASVKRPLRGALVAVEDGVPEQSATVGADGRFELRLPENVADLRVAITGPDSGGVSLPAGMLELQPGRNAFLITLPRSRGCCGAPKPHASISRR